MKIKDIVDLVEYHVQNNDVMFKNKAYEIARDLMNSGNSESANYILSLISENLALTPQAASDSSSLLLHLSTKTDSLYLPDSLRKDFWGLANSIKRNRGIQKILFQGKPGTGKTESAKQLARLLGREAYMVNFPTLVDSHLGQTSKNIVSLFSEINSSPFPEKSIFLFDEIDSLVMDRVDSNDHREMGRATSTFLKQMDSLSPNVLLVATTNLFEKFDDALKRRFDAILNFDCYSSKDLAEIGTEVFKAYCASFSIPEDDASLVKKFFIAQENLPAPGVLKNTIRKSLAFSDPTIEYDYLHKLLNAFVSPNSDAEICQKLKKGGLSLREIERMTGISKSEVSRILKER